MNKKIVMCIISIISCCWASYVRDCPENPNISQQIDC